MIMDKNLKGLKPEAVWKHFAEICNIPHPSHEEDAIRAYIVKWAEEKGLEHKIDEAQNVYVYRPATPGMEDRKGIILQVTNLPVEVRRVQHLPTSMTASVRNATRNRLP